MYSQLSAVAEKNNIKSAASDIPTQIFCLIVCANLLGTKVDPDEIWTSALEVII